MLTWLRGPKYSLQSCRVTPTKLHSMLWIFSSTPVELTQWSVSPHVFDSMQKQTQFTLPSHQYGFKRFCGLEGSFPRRGRTSTIQPGFDFLKKHDSFVCVAWKGRSAFCAGRSQKGQISPALPPGKSDADTCYSLNRSPHKHCTSVPLQEQPHSAPALLPKSCAFPRTT